MDVRTRDRFRLYRSIDRISLLLLAIAALCIAGHVALDDVIGHFLVETLLFLLGIAGILIVTMDIFDFVDKWFAIEE